MIMNTKAKTLKKIKDNLKTVKVLPMAIVQYKCYLDRGLSELNQILELPGDTLVVRSSSVNEDSKSFSNAGKFLTLLNVKKEQKDVEDAIKQVFDSYKPNICDEDEVLIQPMLKESLMSGVAFTLDQDTGAPYYTINYCEGSDTEAVTSGQGKSLKTFIIYKNKIEKIEDEKIEKLVKALKDLERFFDNEALDIEFAFDKNDMLYVLQTRPIATGFKTVSNEVDIEGSLRRIYKKTVKLSKKHPFLMGEGTCFGVMPDWNPAEILGERPKKLAISLYKELVTDSIWAHQRFNYGYRDLTMHPLMISFCGIPYIDTRVSFNSFIPVNLHPAIAEKLVNYYLEKLRKFPGFHDKTEFKIVYSCYYFGLPEELKELKKYGFNDNEISRIEFSLLELTNRIINQKNGLYKDDIEKIRVLEENYQRIMNSDISLVDRIYWLIEECKAYGTLPFAGVARAAFIAVQFLKSFVKLNIITKEEYDLYLNSLSTVNRELGEDVIKLKKGQLSKKVFLEKYGHIRPGTYDILSKRYDEDFDGYFLLDGIEEKEVRNDSNKLEVFDEEKKRLIQTQIDYNGLLISAEDLILFIKNTIEGREKLKFVFTKALSDILRLVEELGNRADVSVYDMAYIDISIIKNLYVDLYTGDLHSLFMENIKANKRQYECATKIKLPSLITNPDDIYSFCLLEEEANYITQKSVVADVCLYEEGIDITGKIVMIQAADPGYDYIFSRGIVGLITQYGGANSHMSIRCSELGIPAVIGAGEKLFNEWKGYNKILLDCLKRQVIKVC